MKNYFKGKRFGRLVVIEETDMRHNNAIVWRCRCDCGNEILVESRKLSSGKVTDCGCVKKEKYKRNIEGQRFGNLVALACTGKKTDRGYYIWRCRCDCGNEIEVSTNSLKQGIRFSCGCAKHDAASGIIGEKYGNITIIGIDQRSKTYSVAKCRCDCGREFYAKKYEVQSGIIKDCGCSRRIDYPEVEAERLEYPPQGRIPKSSTSGFKGVVYNSRRDKWTARIMYKGTNYFLGEYSDLTDAVNARAAKEMEIRSGAF